MRTTKNLLTLAFAMFATCAFAQINTSSHNFAAASWNTGTDEICITCHTPHNAIAAAGPLWNHVQSAELAYDLYSNIVSPTFDADATITQPAGVSKLCLSCHDGTVDLEAYGGVANTGGVTGTLVTGNALLGTDLTTHHPVSFTYDASLVTADGGLHDPAALGLAVTLFAGNVECASCHDPHNAGFASLLVMTNAGSQLCLTCHNK